MDVIEKFCESRDGRRTLINFDKCVESMFLAGVVDGATDRVQYDLEHPMLRGRGVGWHCANLTAAAMLELSWTASAFDLTKAATGKVNQHFGSELGTTFMRRGAVFAAYQDARREIWLLGDCGAAYAVPNGKGGLTWMPVRLPPILGGHAEGVRALRLTYLLERGLITPDTVLRDDPTQPLMAELAESQQAFQNRADGHEYAYGLIDGNPVPEHLIRVVKVPPEAVQVVLHTDGYPMAFPTLEQAEAYIERLRQEDPMLLRLHKATKAFRLLADGSLSSGYDDRTYVRIDLTR